MSRFAAALLALLFSTVAAATPRLVRVDELHPSQVGMGKAKSAAYYKAWKHEAKSRGMSLKQYAKRFLDKNPHDDIIPVDIDPQGEYLNTDAHHHVGGLLKVMKKTGFVPRLRVKLGVDYTGQSEEAFAHDFVDVRGNGWFGNHADGMTAVEKIRSLPHTYAGLKNDKLRSTVGAAFDRLDISGTLFTKYIEFKVGKRLDEAGLYARLRDKGLIDKGTRSIPAHDVFDKHIVKQVVKMLRTPELRTMLLENAVDEAAAKRIAHALDD